MVGTISPDVASAAVALRRSHPHVPPLEVLKVCMRQRAGKVADFGDAVEVGTPFSLIIAEAFDWMSARDWQQMCGPRADPQLAAALRVIWRDEVLPNFARHFDLQT